MPLIENPVPEQLAAALRVAVLRHARSERRKVFAPRLHVGDPGGRQAVFAQAQADGTLDHALRADVVRTLLVRARAAVPPLIWLVRPGALDIEDRDLAWLASARTACSELGVPLTMVVVNRHGWRDPRTGTARTWQRIRERPSS